ncbi:11393_t:CDS:2 [Ambispora gerdemannii]|uniref:11393_t:CDS:1 n=1 Tax=Ambispora gerdemannii TaxID=144530 RepID=A0A9N8Z2A8_9GLOM|nr:11393_t:CDS:2 [Ambispora gerdemannii]
MNIQSLFDVKGKVVLVTGGSRGIGLLIARGYVENGAKVYVSSRSEKVCDQVAKELTKLGPGEAISIPADLQKLSEVKRLGSELKKREESECILLLKKKFISFPLHVLINNAGAAWGAKFDEYPDEAFEKVINLNLKRVFSLTQELVPLLEKSATPLDPARVINIGSIDGLRVSTNESYAYAASKAALHHLTRVMAGQLTSSRLITFNVIAPGPFESKMMAHTLRTRGEVIKDSNPLKRIGSPEDIVGTCIYLSSRAGAYTNGALIVVDGGTLVNPYSKI